MRLLLLILLAALLLANVLCAAPCAPHPATRLILAIDMSASIPVEQRSEWLIPARELAGCLAPGDSLYVYGLHANTGESKPLFAKEYPLKPKQRNLAVLKRWAEERQAFQQGATATLEGAFSAPGAARYTDILALFGRIKTDPGRRTVLVLYTHGLHSTRALDFEKQRLDSRRFPELIRAMGERYGWSRETAGGTHVYFVLPSVGCCDTIRPVNSRLVLEKFYGALAAALNCTLDSFETHLQMEKTL